jgi:hypothetical protein
MGLFNKYANKYLLYNKHANNSTSFRCKITLTKRAFNLESAKKAYALIYIFKDLEQRYSILGFHSFLRE